MNASNIPVYWLTRTLTDVPTGDQWLSEAERLRLRGLRIPKRRQDWRLGRWTAKCAVAAYLQRSHHRASEIEICATVSGAPEVVIRGCDALPSISISHCSGSAVCVVAAPGSAVGCDLERVAPRTDAFYETFFTDCERKELSRVLATERALAACVIWCAKESYLKAIREGLRRSTRDVEVSLENTVGSIQNVVEHSSSGEWSTYRLRCGNDLASGFWKRDKDFVTAVIGTGSRPVSLNLDVVNYQFLPCPKLP
jgi:4'-phosphopantetheinyl transferase